MQHEALDHDSNMKSVKDHCDYHEYISCLFNSGISREKILLRLAQDLFVDTFHFEVEKVGIEQKDRGRCCVD